MEKVNIGLVGFGTVGSGVVKVLGERRKLLQKKLGIKIHLGQHEVKFIWVNDRYAPRQKQDANIGIHNVLIE